MQKLRLDLDALQVESFGTGQSETPQMQGTVRAHESFACTGGCDTVNELTCADQNTCGGATCNGFYTCRYDSCGDCGSYYCGGPSDGFSCVWTCAINC